MNSKNNFFFKFSNFKDYYILTKPSIVRSVLITTAMGFLAATFFSEEPFSAANFLAILLCSFFLCSGICAANQYMEVEDDKKMYRTRNRPLVKEKISLFDAFLFCTGLIIIGLFCMYFYFSWKMFLGGLSTCILYLFIYTPMKKIHWFNTTIGSIPGALPPVGGWVAVTETFNWQCWILFAIIFFWQHPHFYAIARNYRDDYQKAGFKMLSSFDDMILMKHVIVNGVLLLLSNLFLLVFIQEQKILFLLFILLLNFWFLWTIIKVYNQMKNHQPTEEVISQKMKSIIFYSVIYLPLLLGIFGLGLFLK